MNNRLTKTPTVLLSLLLLFSCENPSEDTNEHSVDFVSFVQNDSLNRLDIFIDQKYFSSYLYADSSLALGISLFFLLYSHFLFDRFHQ
ncbi:MAG: hypothetical protein OCD76_14815 [Reichenbachiella sp.]